MAFFSTYVSLNVDDLCSSSGIRRGSVEILDRECVAKPIEMRSSLPERLAVEDQQNWYLQVACNKSSLVIHAAWRY